MTSNLIVTLSPQIHSGKVNLQIALFDTSNPFEFTKIASCPIIKQCNAHAFNLQQLAYNEASDTILVVIGFSPDGFELKLSKLQDCGHPSEVPDFVKPKQMPDGMGTVNAIHVRPADKTMFFILDNGYCTLAPDGETFSAVRPYNSIHPDAEGGFMGF